MISVTIKASLAALAVGAALIVGCASGHSHSKPSPSTPTQLFIAKLRSERIPEGGVDAYSDNDLVSWGHTVCTYMSTQHTGPVEAAQSLVRNGWNAFPAEAVVQASQSYLCGTGTSSP